MKTGNRTINVGGVNYCLPDAPERDPKAEKAAKAEKATAARTVWTDMAKTLLPQTVLESDQAKTDRLAKEINDHVMKKYGVSCPAEARLLAVQAVAKRLSLRDCTASVDRDLAKQAVARQRSRQRSRDLAKARAATYPRQ